MPKHTYHGRPRRTKHQLARSRASCDGLFLAFFGFVRRLSQLHDQIPPTTNGAPYEPMYVHQINAQMSRGGVLGDRLSAPNLVMPCRRNTEAKDERGDAATPKTPAVGGTFRPRSDNLSKTYLSFLLPHTHISLFNLYTSSGRVSPHIAGGHVFLP